MPELPEVEGYLEGLRSHVVGQRLEAVRLASPFLLRSVEPPLDAAVGDVLIGARRIGKRIVFAWSGGTFWVLHPMIAGRLRWKGKEAKLGGKAALAAFDMEGGSLVLTEQGSKRPASLFVVGDEAGLAGHDPGGVEPLEVDAATLAAALADPPRTLKRALCDPHQVSGIGNGWSDEILFTARLSPFLRTAELGADRAEVLWRAPQDVLTAARDRHVAAARLAFPDRVTAFQPEMHVHGRFREPCHVCEAPIQRIVRSSSEFHYCPGCQTGGKLLADRALSRLLKDDWPRTLADLE